MLEKIDREKLDDFWEEEGDWDWDGFVSPEDCIVEAREEVIEADIEDYAEEEGGMDKYILYVVIDRENRGLINYLRESGLKVSSVYRDIVTCKNAILMQSAPIRIVVIDTGLGKFTTTSMRNELIDMLGISDDQNRITVFYTDSALKVDTMRMLGRSGKGIDWIPYTSTAVVAATLLSYGDEYVYDLADKEDEFDSERSILSFRGIRSKVVSDRHTDISGFSSTDIIKNIIESDKDLLVEYRPNI